MPSQRTIDFAYDPISLEDGGTTPPVPMAPYLSVSYQFIFDADGGDSAGSIYLESSNDGSHWSQYPGSVLAYDNGVDNHIIELDQFRSVYIRARVVNASGTGGSAAIIAHITTVAE